MSSKKLILHIGAPKTGTTYLQGVLWANREELAAQGVHLPGRRQGRHYAIGNDLLGDSGTAFTRQARIEGTWERFVSRLAQNTAETVLLTDERLCALDASGIDKVASLAPDREIHVVYAARDLSELFPSAWQEQVKHGIRTPFGEWSAKLVERHRQGDLSAWFWRVHDAGSVLERWSAAVDSPNHVHVVTMAATSDEPDALWRDFARAAGLPVSLPNEGERGANVSLDYAQIEVLRGVNAIVRPRMDPEQYRYWVRDFLAKDIMGRGRVGVRPAIPDQLHEGLSVIAEGIVSTIAGSGYEVVGDLSDLLPKADPDTKRSIPTDGVVGQAAINTIAEVIGALDAGRSRPGPRAAQGSDSRWQRFSELAVDQSRRSPLLAWCLNLYRRARRVFE